ncbi:hypothetical protein CGMCC3_g7671 [Colletotrichum fructicola]|nr:uncharacterized protein CGMCC3_g7671 [Colletotrichum fructicola]KAE9576018.1 hypothetical protein CGMCC3_g7671 [Colletotrichum fructicola]
MPAKEEPSLPSSCEMAAAHCFFWVHRCEVVCCPRVDPSLLGQKGVTDSSV